MTKWNTTAGTFVYDAFGRRAEESYSATGKTTDFIYDLAGHILHRDNSASDGWGHEIYVGNQHIAVYANGKTYFNYGDQVGSLRLWTQYNSAGSTVVQTCQNLPYGDGQSCTGASTPDQFHFADQRVDSDNVGYTWFRRYSSTQARWTTPDPGRLAVVSPLSPQSWNSYAYVGNNPVTFSDPLGLYHCNAADGGSVDASSQADCESQGGIWFADTGDPGVTPINMSLIFQAPPGTSVTYGPDALSGTEGYGGTNDFFDPTSLAFQTFGPPSRGIWGGAASFVNIAGGATLAAVGGVFAAPTLAAAPTAAVGILARGVGWAAGLTGELA